MANQIMIFLLTMNPQKYLTLLQEQMEIDQSYQKSISKIFKSEVPFYNNEKLYKGAIKIISEKSGIPEDEINHFIYEQGFGSHTGITIEQFVNDYNQ